MNTAAFTAYREKVVSNCARVIVGKEDATEKILVSFLCGGHVLLEDKPGTGKTMLLRAFARTVGGDFKRVQFTPDLLPSDLTGINSTTRSPVSSSSGPARSSPTLCWRTRSTVPRPVPSRPCWKPWRKGRLPWTA